MNPDIALIRSAVADTFEKMAFIEALPAEEGSTGLADGAEVCQASIEVPRPVKWVIELRMPAELAREVASSAFGSMDEMSPEVVNDSVAELLNVLAGTILRLHYPNMEIFELGLPAISSAAGPVQSGALATEHFDLSGSPLDVTVRAAS
jgi:CheY-specific phosphatase CheX